MRRLAAAASTMQQCPSTLDLGWRLNGVGHTHAGLAQSVFLSWDDVLHSRDGSHELCC
jgi:hypothetical protein